MVFQQIVKMVFTMAVLGHGALLFFFNDTATTEIYTLSLHDALPISGARAAGEGLPQPRHPHARRARPHRSEEHTSELQSRLHLVCRLLLEKKKRIHIDNQRIQSKSAKTAFTLSRRRTYRQASPRANA